LSPPWPVPELPNTPFSRASGVCNHTLVGPPRGMQGDLANISLSSACPHFEGRVVARSSFLWIAGIGWGCTVVGVWWWTCVFLWFRSLYSARTRYSGLIGAVPVSNPLKPDNLPSLSHLPRLTIHNRSKQFSTLENTLPSGQGLLCGMQESPSSSRDSFSSNSRCSTVSTFSQPMTETPAAAGAVLVVVSPVKNDIPVGGDTMELYAPVSSGELLSTMLSSDVPTFDKQQPRVVRQENNSICTVFAIGSTLWFLLGGCIAVISALRLHASMPVVFRDHAMVAQNIVLSVWSIPALTASVRVFATIGWGICMAYPETATPLSPCT
jgi:hypothetical protein